MNRVIYRDIPGWPGYRVGDDGSVWFAWITCRSGRRLTDRWKPMKIGYSEKGYARVNLTPPEGGKYKTFKVHRIVLEVFVGPCPSGMECRHLDNIKANCRLGNLEWATPVRNRRDIRDADDYQRGEDHSQAKLTDAQVDEIRERYSAGNVLQRELAAEYGMSLPQISNIVRHRSRTKKAKSCSAA